MMNILVYHTFLTLPRECDPGVALELPALFTNRNSGEARTRRGPLSAATGTVPMTSRVFRVAQKALACVRWAPHRNYMLNTQVMRGKRRISMGERLGQKTG
jgi:hypothetical protein